MTNQIFNRPLTAVAAMLFFTPALIMTTSCSRSRQYVQEKQYYQTDTEYDRQGHEVVADKAEKFSTPKRRIFVLPFFNATPFDKKAGAAGGPDDIGVFVADSLIREIRMGGKAIVPENLRSADTSRDFYVGDKVRVGNITREGRKLGVSLLIVGRIKKISYRQKADEMGYFKLGSTVVLLFADGERMQWRSGLQAGCGVRFGEALGCVAPSVM